VYADGRRYEGDWEKDKEHGKGKEIRLDGTCLYDGIYKEGKFHG